MSIIEQRLHVLGRGPPVVVLHGGPGFSHAYLVPHLAPLAASRTLIFFDQLSSRSKRCPGIVTAEQVFADARDVIDHVFTLDRAEVIAHSWGALVLLGALIGRPDMRMSGILISPVPTNRARFDQMRSNLFSRFEPDLLARMSALPDKALDGLALKPFLAHYLSNQDADLTDLSFSPGDYRQIIETLGDYDMGRAVPQLADCHVILGEDDFIAADLLEDYASHCSSMTLLPDAGHFPFAERPEAFLGHVLESL